MARLASLVGWNGGGGWRERRARQRLRRRQYCGGTVWLGRRRRPAGRSRLAVSRLVRWRLVAELLRPDQEGADGDGGGGGAAAAGRAAAAQASPSSASSGSRPPSPDSGPIS
ncbi:hypothetical protein OsJ_16489 [Oryza sativa Japonica Group]|uniref:Uncharacterized protein n=1 Tax=Oryza sativa subsp. japonica TaxID=39947 RepID=B9FCY2_ORYSJ|nr:hypothetical protein OsJ_16489 [Oryza sativa Japonica Group]